MEAKKGKKYYKLSFNNPYSQIYPWETSSQEPEQFSSQVQRQFMSLDPDSQVFFHFPKKVKNNFSLSAVCFCSEYVARISKNQAYPEMP